MIELRNSSWYQSGSSYRESARERGAAQELSLQYRAALPIGRAVGKGLRRSSCQLQCRAALPIGRAIEGGMRRWSCPLQYRAVLHNSLDLFPL